MMNLRSPSLPAVDVESMEDSASVALTARVDPLIGTTLNSSYRVEGLLGEGGMGQVYWARHTRIQQKRVAIKVLRGEFARNAEVLARFQREAEAAASISHPNVVGAYDVDRTPQGLPYIASEYLEGLDLHDHLKAVGKLSLETAVWIARQLCEGLTAAHARGVIHRDLKPHNIFLVGDFTDGVPERPMVKILDFGLSKFLEATDDLVTKAGIVMGTPAFMPPEQARGQSSDQRSDIYGVGAILYNLLTGRQPFEEATAQATVLAVMSHEPPRPRSLEPSIPEHAELVIQRAMAKNPAERYPDMPALRQALLPLLVVTHSLPPPAPGLPPARRAQVSRAALDVDGEPTRAARLRLLAYGGLLLTLWLCSAAVVTTGLERTLGMTFSRVELTLFVLFATLAAASPAALWLRHIRRNVWNSTLRVLGLLTHVRSAVFVTIALYGASWLGFRLVDRVLPRFANAAHSAAPLGLHWSGWDVLLPALAVLTVLAVLTRRRLVQAPAARTGRRIAALALLLLPLLAAAATLQVGLRWQDRVAPRITAEAKSSPVRALPAAHPPMPVRSAEQLAAPVAPGVASAAAPAAPVEPPADRRVLREAVRLHASKASGHSDALQAAARLFRLLPAQSEPEVSLIVTQIAERGEPIATQALELAATEMGVPGHELLYRWLVTKPTLAPRAKQLLAVPATRASLSDGLAIAVDLRSATSCAARLPLLARAADVGDERALTALSALSSGTTRGCGRGKRKPCKPACVVEAAAFRQTMDKIQRRLHEPAKAP